MKRMMTIALLSVTLAVCGEGGALNDTLEISVRESLVATCTTAAGEQIPEGVDVDVGTVCGYAADKVMNGQSVADLVANPPSPIEAMSKVQACLLELGPVKIDAAA